MWGKRGVGGEEGKRSKIVLLSWHGSWLLGSLGSQKKEGGDGAAVDVIGRG